MGRRTRAAQLDREISSALRVHATKRSSQKQQKRYRLTIARPHGGYVESHFNASEKEALKRAEEEIEQGAPYVRVDTDVDFLSNKATLVTELWKPRTLGQ